MKQKTFLYQFVLLLSLLVGGTGNACGAEGDELAICQGTGSGYGVRRTLTDSHSVGWVLSSSQSGYLGANNATNHGNVKPTAADLPVVKAVKSEATTATTGYYFYYTTTAVANVGSVEFSYTANSGNSSATAYVVVGDAQSVANGTAYEIIELSNTSPTAQNASLSTSGTFTYTFKDTQASARYYGFIIVTSSYKRLTGGTIKLKEGASASKVKAPTVTIPTTTPFVSSKTVNMTCDTEGADIYYTMGDNPANPTSSSTKFTAPFSIDATTKIKAIAIKDGMDNSNVTSVTFTKETVLDGIAALNAATTSNTATPHYVNLTDAQVTFVNRTDGFLNDANAGIFLFSTSPTLNTKYNGIYKITTKTYYSWVEATAFETIEGESSSEIGSTMAPVVMTASELETNFNSNISRKIRIENLTLTSDAKVTDNISISTTYHSALAASKTYTIVGYPSLYNSSKQFKLVTAYSKPAAPTFDPIEGEFSEAFTLHLACATDGVTIYYTTNGDTPTTSSTVYNDATGIAIPNASTTVKAIAYYEGMTSDVASATYDYRVVAKPQFSVADLSELYYGETVSITCATDGADIYYTVDGTTPTSSSTKYTAPVAITDLVEINAIAIKGSDESSVATATYAVKAPAAPTFNVEAGAVARNTVVTISSREGTTIWYSTDGTDPSVDAEGNTKEITITAGMTIRAIAIDPLDNDSPETSATYTIAQVATPVIDTAAGMLSKGTLVHITTATDGASIYYTLDGTTPTASSNPYNGYVVISKAETLKAIAIKENYIDSEIASVAYTVAGDNESVTFSEKGYSNAGDVTSYDGSDFSIAFALGTNSNSNSPKYYDAGTGVRMYTGNTMTISSSTQTITSIVFTFDGSNTTLTLPTGQPGTLGDASDSKRTWTGNTTSVQFSTTATNRIKSITVYFALSDDAATVGSSKLAGYCSEYKLDFSETGLKVYKAKVDGEGNVVLTQIADGIVPANEGVILSGNADDYNIPISTADVTADFSDNEMVGVTQRTLVEWTSTDGKHNYILQQGEFNKATDGYLKPNRAYLHTTFDVSASPANKMTIIFNDSETDGIRSIENGKLNIETSAYNLAGQRVDNDYKGIVIVNGKKMLNK